MSARKNLAESVASVASVAMTRSEWVDVQMIRVFMRDTVLALYVALTITCVIAVLLFSNIPFPQIALWVSAQIAVVFARLQIVWIYREKFQDAGNESSVLFIQRYEWLWPLSAFVWGSLVWLFFLKASTFDQFVCLLILVGVATTSVPSFGSRLRCALQFVDVLHFSVLAIMTFRLVTADATERLPPAGEIAWLAGLVLVHWALVRIGAKRFNSILRSGFKVQFDNTVLINSLTEKSRAALQAVIAKDRFIASAAHDLRQPVHALNLYAGWLENDPQLVAEITPKIVRSTQVLDELFDSLFYFSGLNSEPLHVKLQPVDLQQLLHDMKHQFEALAIERHLHFYVHIAQATLRTDPALLKRVLGNFLSNAFKHTQHGSVTLSAKPHKGRWRIEVLDTGPGIAEEHQKAIFEEFYRTPAPGTAEGFGLGLAIVVRLSRAMSHRVGLRSSLGAGSLFWVEVDAANLPIDVQTHSPAHSEAALNAS